MSFTSWARIWIDPSLWTFWLIWASDTLNLEASWTRKIQRKQVGFFFCFENNTKKLYSIPVNHKSAYFPFSFSSIQNWNWAFRKMDISILDKMALIILAFNFREPFSTVETELHSQVKWLWHRPGKIWYFSN